MILLEDSEVIVPILDSFSNMNLDEHLQEQDYFLSFIAICEYLMSCKERLAREFNMLLYKLLFEELRDTFSRQEVYEVFSLLALLWRSSNRISSILYEVLMIIRKQISNADIMYKKMRVIETLKIVSTLGDVKSPSSFLSSQVGDDEYSQGRKRIG